MATIAACVPVRLVAAAAMAAASSAFSAPRRIGGAFFIAGTPFFQRVLARRATPLATT
jgi:hypothetical protein